MAYFAGPNVTVSIKPSEPIDSVVVTPKVLSECAGVSYVLNNSQQPIYGYASTQFDAMLPGREIVQGNLLLNHTSPIPFYEILNKSSNTSNSEGLISYNGFLNEPLDIIIKFKKDHEIIINYCYIFSRGETIQISEQGIVEEYSFIGRSLSYKKGA
jgi:hypothetical protein